jgi:hypothetical protein
MEISYLNLILRVLRKSRSIEKLNGFLRLPAERRIYVLKKVLVRLSEAKRTSCSRSETREAKLGGLVSVFFRFPVIRKTISAVNWSFGVKFERHFGFNTAIRTDCLVHFSGSSEKVSSKNNLYH